MVALIGLCSCSKGDKPETEELPELKNENPQTERALTGTAPEARLNYYNSLPETVIDESKRYIATIHTNKGDIIVKLDALTAPLHTNNFVFLSQQGFYDGLLFHRVEPNFVIQGGDPTGSGRGGPGYKIPAEIALPHQQGAIAMARMEDTINPEKMSSGSQFYITLSPQPFLDQAGYSVFGRVMQGFDVVQKIQRGDVINRIDILEK